MKNKLNQPKPSDFNALGSLSLNPMTLHGELKKYLLVEYRQYFSNDVLMI